MTVNSPAKAPQTFLAKLWSNKTVHQSLRINGLKAVSLAFGFMGSVWSSRCLGPDNLGISGMILGTMTPLVFLINLNQTAHFVRLYRGTDDEAEKTRLVATISTYKIATSFLMAILAVPLILMGGFSTNWHLALLAAFPWFLFTANAADWLLQCEDKMPTMTMATTVQALVTTSLYFIFFRPGTPAGTDLVVQDIGLGAAFFLAWRAGLNKRAIPLFGFKYLPGIIPIVKEGRWLVLSGLAVYVYTILEMPLIGWLYSVKELGIYRTSVTLVMGFTAFTGYLPMLLYPRMMEWLKVSPQNLWLNLKKFVISFSIFTACLSLGAFLFSPLAYHYVYGAAFQRGAYPFALLLTAKMIAVMNGVMAWSMAAQKKDKAVFYIMINVSVVSLIFNVVMIPHFGAIGASIVNVLSEMFMFTLVLTSILRSLKNA